MGNKDEKKQRKEKSQNAKNKYLPKVKSRKLYSEQQS
jgi:hypothetical protein